MTALGDLARIDDRTVLVLGQELNVARNQPDAANSLVHRVGDTLVIVDTGVTTQFRDALLAATREVGTWTRALVLTTHGHTDHVGNNDIADELGVPTEHYVPARDLDQMRDPASYWVRAFTPIAGVVPLPAPPSGWCWSAWAWGSRCRPPTPTRSAASPTPSAARRPGWSRPSGRSAAPWASP